VYVRRSRPKKKGRKSLERKSPYLFRTRGPEEGGRFPPLFLERKKGEGGKGRKNFFLILWNEKGEGGEASLFGPVKGKKRDRGGGR